MARSFSTKGALLLISLLIPGVSVGDPSGGSQVAYLSQILQQAREQVESLKNQLEEMKVTSDEVLAVRKTLQDVKDEYEYVKGFNPQAELNELKRWGEKYTYLDDLADAKSFEARWGMLYGEVSKRFKAAGIDDEDKVVAETRKLFLEQEEQRRLLERYRQAALDLNEGASYKDLQQQIASSTAMTASLLLEQKIKDLEEQIAARETIIRQVEWDASFMNYLGGKHGR